MKRKIIHCLSLVDIGGVQKSFLPYMEYAQKNSQFEHLVFSLRKKDKNYENLGFAINYLFNPFSFVKFFFYLKSSSHIVHFYNNFGSKKLKNILNIVNPKNVIIHERGGAWNLPTNEKSTFLHNQKKASLILANSIATKELLVQKFGLDENKINVIYNGVEQPKVSHRKSKLNNNKFTVGYIGRFDTNKGVHVLIEAVKKINNVELLIAGWGPLESTLKELSIGCDRIKFLGTFTDPYRFHAKLDLLVVPSVREPLGNVIIEAGFMQIPVIASNVDGIPELIENKKDGLLIDPTEPLRSFENIKDSLPYPEYVINGVTKKLDKPSELNINELVRKINFLIKNPKKCIEYGKSLDKKSKKNNTIDRYYFHLEELYHKMLSN